MLAMLAFFYKLQRGGLFGALAVLLSAATGQQALASGAATGLLILSFLISGIVPLIDGWQDWAKISPWYYINDGEPLANGVQWGPVLVILAIAVAMIGSSFALLDARAVAREPAERRASPAPRCDLLRGLQRGHGRRGGGVVLEARQPLGRRASGPTAHPPAPRARRDEPRSSPRLLTP